MPLKAVANPPNPWADTLVDYLEGSTPDARLAVYEDHSRSLLSSNDSPDVAFGFSANPYRGCYHGCAYCYARPTHEYLSLGAGTDFDRKLVVKPHAAELLREAFLRKSWRGETIVFSGVTDCYQPLEASYRLTRACLEVCLDFKNPVGIITKAPLIERDVDLLADLSRVARLRVAVSVPFWDEEKARALEPYVAKPSRRMHIVETLAARGVPVHVMVAPIIPGLSEDEVGSVMRAAKEAGARSVGWVLLRLPGSVAKVFEERLRAALPLRADKVLRRIRETRGGKLNDPRFGKRGTGEGTYADALQALLRRTAEQVGLRDEDGGLGGDEPTTFRRPLPGHRLQLPLFEG